MEQDNRDFSTVPFSDPSTGNPFSMDLTHLKTSPFLLHAILALTSQHLAKRDDKADLAVQSKDHWSTAVKLYSTAVTKEGHPGVVDTLVSLMHYGVTQSAIGTWTIHLTAGIKIFEQLGALQRMNTDTKLRAQIAIGVWYAIQELKAKIHRN